MTNLHSCLLVPNVGCVYGGRLTALLLPDHEYISVPARRVYLKYGRSKSHKMYNYKDDVPEGFYSLTYLRTHVLTHSPTYATQILGINTAMNLNIPSLSLTKCINVISLLNLSVVSRPHFFALNLNAVTPTLV